MGTKFRKFWGIHSDLEKKKIKKVVLQGELHSNALTAFAFLFYNFGYKVRTLCYTRDKIRISANSIFVKKNSHFLEKWDSRSNWKNAVEQIQIDKESEVLIPEYGLILSASNSLHTIWKQIRVEEWDSLIIDLGSGLTWLSAKCFYQNQIPIYGISIGLSKKKMIPWLEEKRNSLGLENFPIKESFVLESGFRQGFGSLNSNILEYCNSFYLKSGIPIEPIYSGRSLFAIEKKMEQGELIGKILYLHQGGLWNFLDALLAKKDRL